MILGASTSAGARNRWRHTRIAQRGILAITAGLIVIVSVIHWGDWPSPESNALPPHVDAIVALGGGQDDRARSTVALLEQGIAEFVVVTGDSNLIANYLRAHGVSESQIIQEPNAKSTVENAELVSPILRSMNARRVIIVTSWFHTRRAKAVFEKTMPEIRFYVTSLQRPASLPEWDRQCQRRERYAAIYYLLRYGIWP